MSLTCQLSNQLLIAMPLMSDPAFFHSVTLICEHSQDGAMGIVVNRKSDITLGEMFQELEIDCTDIELNEQTVFLGGPVQVERGFVLHNGLQPYDASIEVGRNLYMTSSREILEDIANGSGPTQFLVALGYAGWGSGQLEDEMKDNAWLNASVSNEIIFTLPVAQRWDASASLLGIDINALANISGRA